ncbi:hypothetical protein PG999_011282 [Apiospora kogelbergensis]|uniref:Ubiquitin-like protease family profile domain-containing protein n=1 Tax=Apiospora kogelbergensis TaxID=1337665 RepID=A0AAW0QCH8_9PEZI
MHKRIWTKIRSFGAPTPINTLERDNSNGAPLSTTRPVQETIDSPPSKRQRLRQSDDQNKDEDAERRPVPYSNSEFALRDDAMLAARPSQKNDSHGNLSPDAIQPRVAEFDRVESLIHPPSPVLGSRRLKSGKHQADEVIHLASDDGGSEDPIDLIQTRKQEHPAVGTDELAHRFVSKSGSSTKRILRQPDTVKSRMRGPFLAATRKRPRSSSVDELAGDSPISKARPTKRIATNLSSSSSGESRGHISPVRLGLNSSQATRQLPNKCKTTGDYAIKAKHIITSTGLSVERAVSGSFAYPSSAGDMHVPCVLCVHEISHLLHPTDERGSILGQLAYLTVNLAKVNKVQIPKEKTHPIVALFRSVEPNYSAAAKLHIEFGSQKDVQAFLKWAQMPRPGSFPLQVEEVPGDRLAREMDNLGSKATHGYVIRDVDEKRPEQSDDIRLVEHNQEKRKQQQPKPKLIHALASPDTARVRPRIKDTMRSPMSQQHVEVLDHETPQSPAIRQTRAKRKIQSPSPPPPDLWTEKNPSWPLQWRDSLIFPPVGKNRATVDKVDIPRLDEGQLLNDNLIIFYLRYLQHDLELRRPDLAERIYFHNTFFYEKLKPTKGSPGINYDSVKAWTTKVDLFTKDFIVVPINEFSHWYIAIIYNAPKLDTTAGTLPAADSSVTHSEDLAGKSGNVACKEGTEQMAKTSVNTAGEVTVGINHMSLESSGSDPKLAVIEPSTISRDAKGLAGSDNQVEELSFVSGAEPKKPFNKGNPRGKKHNPDEPKIITLDSLGSGHSPACRNLKDYLIKELRDKKGVDMPDPGSLTMTAKGIPTQKNYCDCGVYLLGYVVRFLHDPDAFIRTLLLHEDIEWDIDAPALRNDIRTLLFQLQGSK